MTKITWNVEEQGAVCDEVVRIQPFGEAGTSVLNSFRKAQTILPPPRQRHLENKQALSPSLLALLEAKLKARKAVPAPLPPPEPVPPSTLEELIARLTEQFAETFALQLNVALKRRVASVLDSSVSATVETDRQQKRRVLVIGPRNDQFQLLVQQFGKLLDLRFADKTKSPRELSQAAATCHTILVWADFVSHSVHDHIPRERTRIVRGGMEAVRTALEEIYCL